MRYTTKAGIEQKFMIGLDLGQVNDYTALVVLERLQTYKTEQVAMPRERDRYVVNAWEWQEVETVDQAYYHARHIERFRLGTPYPDMIERVKQLTETDELKDRYGLIIDQTGVGRPVFDIALQAGLNAIGLTITGGDAVTWVNRTTVRVAKRQLASTLHAVVLTKRLEIARSMPYADTLTSELLTFGSKITDSANDIYEGREGAHDDLVLALALALWAGEALASRQKKVAKQIQYLR